jgi:predicted ATPase
MLKELTIKNFKAIQDMNIEFTPLTVLIGGNSCGKTTVLQAIDFLRSAAARDIPEYLMGCKWEATEIKSRISNKTDNPIEMKATFSFFPNSIVDWYFIADFNDGKWSIRELLCVNGKGVISYRTMPNLFDGLAISGVPEPFKNIKLESSCLKVIDDYLETVQFGREEIKALKEYLQNIKNIDLLSPEKIRTGKDLKFAAGIGTGGEALAQYISRMSKKNKEELEKTVSDLIGIKINVQIRNIEGKYIIFISENFESSIVETSVSHISDGMLRLLAFAAIIQRSRTTELAIHDENMNIESLGAVVFQDEELLRDGMILLDEIEDGINPYLTEKLIGLFRALISETNQQIIFTTHSPVVLNDIKPEEIVFLWKDKNGSVHSKKMFSTQEMQEALEFLNPGEIWENFGRETILQKLKISEVLTQ